ncbi:acyl-homoserine-lactone synthase [Ruegeria sp. ANG-R]|uniref:acyl-homoserine-lactone synthase n=1 Tax=Ruegeria sp. ANG-R TaxID=1577903 RepID=UPI0006916584|nr:acyl-homoserine-lactone synthase [Ruegeria sp. ANG-R]
MAYSLTIVRNAKFYDGEAMKLESKILKIFDPQGDNDLLYQMFAMRKQLFVDHLKWDLDHFDEIEVDQYDNPHSRYVVVFDEQRKVVGCTRLMPTTSKLKYGFTYMIRDASLGMLDSIPTDLIEQAPVDDSVWEATRFAVSTSLPNDKRNIVLTAVCEAAVNYARTQGVKEILGLMSPFFLRWLPRAGFDVSAAGPTISAGGDPCCVIRYST